MNYRFTIYLSILFLVVGNLMMFYPPVIISDVFMGGVFMGMSYAFLLETLSLKVIDRLNQKIKGGVK